MLLRNREVKRTLILAVILCVLGAFATGTIVALYANNVLTISTLELETLALLAATGVLVSGIFIITAFMYATRQRYRDLARMAEKLDAALSSERSIGFCDMKEGELAILASELDKVITRLNLTVDELQTEKLALSDALADISHQLKTPLTSIALSTELMRKRLIERDDAPEILERVRLIQNLQYRVENLIAVLLKLARIDAGVIKLVKAPVLAEELIQKAYEPLAVAFDIADITFEADVQPGAQFDGDLTWSAEALENIIKNCMEYTPAGGHVRVRATEDVLACRIRIEDTGPGIAQADLPHIFERFYRASRDEQGSSKVNPTGVGIGLSLSKSLVTAQGGTITAENVKDSSGAVCGAAFTLVFFKTVV